MYKLSTTAKTAKKKEFIDGIKDRIIRTLSAIETMGDIPGTVGSLHKKQGLDTPEGLAKYLRCKQEDVDQAFAELVSEKKIIK